jgi:hypothetical protein
MIPSCEEHLACYINRCCIRWHASCTLWSTRPPFLTSQLNMTIRRRRPATLSPKLETSIRCSLPVLWTCFTRKYSVAADLISGSLMRESLSTDCRTLLQVRERVRVAKDDSEYHDKRQINMLRALLRTIFLAAVTAEACFLLNAENVNVRALENKLQSVALFEQFKYLVSRYF